MPTGHLVLDCALVCSSEEPWEPRTLTLWPSGPHGIVAGAPSLCPEAHPGCVCERLPFEEDSSAATAASEPGWASERSRRWGCEAPILKFFSPTAVILGSASVLDGWEHQRWELSGETVFPPSESISPHLPLSLTLLASRGHHTNDRTPGGIKHILLLFWKPDVPSQRA